MNTATTPARRDAMLKDATPGGDTPVLLTALDRILDKGLVIDAWASVPVVGISVLTIDARIYVASWQRYLQFADVMASVPPTVLPALPDTPMVDSIGPLAGEPAPATALERLPEGKVGEGGHQPGAAT